MTAAVQLHSCAWCAVLVEDHELVMVEAERICADCAGTCSWCGEPASELIDAAKAFEGECGEICRACWLKHDDELDRVVTCDECGGNGCRSCVGGPRWN